MKITDVRLEGSSGLLRLVTDGPHQGWATGVSTALAAIIDRVYRPLLLGASPWEREQVWQSLRTVGQRAGLPPASWGVVDIALWDLLGKVQDLPVFRVIGGFRQQVPAYLCATAAGTASLVDQARKAREAGFFGFKFPLAYRDVSLLRQLRRGVGDEFRLLCDGAQALDLAEGLAMGRVLDEIGAHWFEDPLRERDLTGLQKLADALDTPLVGGTFAEGAPLAGTRALTSRAVDRLRATIPTMGGITDALKLARGAEALGFNCEIDWDRRAGPHAAAHVLGALRNAEFLSCDPAGGVSEGGPLPVVAGAVQLPLVPGLGLAEPALGS